jgi:hypothetical protein
MKLSTTPVTDLLTCTKPVSVPRASRTGAGFGGVLKRYPLKNATNGVPTLRLCPQT